MKQTRQPPLRHLLAVTAFALSPLATAQEAGSQVVDQVTLQDDESCYQLDIDFNFPLTYLRHSPASQGKDLYIRIKLAPLAEGDAALLRERRAVSLPHAANTPLLALIYEGDTEEGPTLVLHYREAQQFSIEPGDNGRSLTIQFGLPIDHCIHTTAAGAE